MLTFTPTLGSHYHLFHESEDAYVCRTNESGVSTYYWHVEYILLSLRASSFEPFLSQHGDLCSHYMHSLSLELYQESGIDPCQVR